MTAQDISNRIIKKTGVNVFENSRRKDENPRLEELENQFNFAPIDLDTLDKIHMLENKVKNLKKRIEKYEKIN